jgi:hypothetical protein
MGWDGMGWDKKLGFKAGPDSPGDVLPKKAVLVVVVLVVFFDQGKNAEKVRSCKFHGMGWDGMEWDKGGPR